MVSASIIIKGQPYNDFDLHTFISANNSVFWWEPHLSPDCGLFERINRYRVLVKGRYLNARVALLIDDAESLHKHITDFIDMAKVYKGFEQENSVTNGSDKTSIFVECACDNREHRVVFHQHNGGIDFITKPDTFNRNIRDALKYIFLKKPIPAASRIMGKKSAQHLRHLLLQMIYIKKSEEGA